MTGACGCSSIRDCFYELQCQIVVQREVCSIPRSTCCVPAWFNGHAYRDNGSPANCCSGTSNNGFCTCVATGQPSGGDASRCCSQHDTAGACSCLPNGASCLLERDSNGECCSGQCKERGRFLYQCVESLKGQPCQTDAGCAQGLKCVDQKCA